MDPLDTPEPMALINRQEDPIPGGPTLAPLEAWVEEEPAWDEVLESAFFDTIEPAPARDADDEPLVVRRNRVLEWGLAFTGVCVIGAALAVAGVALSSGEETAEPPVFVVDAPPATEAVGAPDASGVPAAVSVDAAVLIDFSNVRSVGESDGRGPRRRTRSVRTATRALPDRVVPAPKPGPVALPAREPMRVDALPPAISVSALPPAE
ncbi:MAG: hypothetical protein R3F61_03750 [Myxococcota bacterium]